MVYLEKEGKECSLLPCNGLLLVYGVGAPVICSGDKWIINVFVLAFFAHSLFLSSSIPFQHHFKVNVTCSQHFKKIFKHTEKLKGLVNTVSQVFYIFSVFQVIAALLMFRLCHLLLTGAVSCGLCDLSHSHSSLGASLLSAQQDVKCSCYAFPASCLESAIPPSIPSSF